MSITKIYDLLVTELIQEIYYNKFTIDISKLNIKELAKMMEAIKNGN